MQVKRVPQKQTSYYQFGVLKLTPNYHLCPTGRRTQEVWIDEGKDSEGRREWMRRWNEAADVLLEEDVTELFIMDFYSLSLGIWLSVRVPSCQHIFTLTGIDETDTVADLKEKIEDEERIAVYHQSLGFKARQLIDGDMLQKYGISSGDTINLYLPYML